MPWWLRCFGKSYEPPEVMELDYRHSNLTEVPPDVFTYERTLEKLSLASNQVTTLPPSLFHCYELRELELYDNELQAIPAAIGSLTRLTRLDASRNGITEVPDTIKNCKNLSYLNLSLNHLVKLPEGISQLIGLEELNLSDTYLEYLNANFGRLTKLRVLDLRENVLQSLPKSMTRFTHLQRLDLGQNDLHEIPEVIGTMTNLTELFLDNNSIRSIPTFIGQLSKLGSIDCSNNDVYEIADEICRCTQLTDLTLNINNIEGLPDAFGKLESLTVLRLDNNQIHYLPENFGQLKNLQELSVMRNLLKALPPSIGLMRKLHTLLLDENLLTDLPKEIGSCVQLSILHVAKNRLSAIPSEIGHLSNLAVLSLSGNSLAHLPVSILNIPKLGAIWLSQSQSIPLLPLNKEVDLYTGQHVLTCFLLPQFPTAEVEQDGPGRSESESAEGVGRYRQSTIKFADIADESGQDESPEEQTATTSHRPMGLFRAPTPYPKELRALAKHASQIYTRHSRDQNGDIPNTDVAVHESDLDAETNGDLRVVSDSNKSEIQRNERPGTSENLVLDRWKSSESERLLPHQTDRDSDYRSAHYDSIRRLRLGHSSGTSRTTPELPDLTDLTNGLSADSPIISSHPWNSYMTANSEMAARTPPPYHVAARRAAFFRTASSTLDTSALSNGKSQVKVTTIPSMVTNMSSTSFPLIENTDFNYHVKDNEQNLLNNDEVDTPLHGKQNLMNLTFTIEDPSTPLKVYTSALNTTFTISAPSFDSRDSENSTCLVSNEAEDEVQEKEKRIIESIIRDGTALSNPLAEDLEGATDSSEGPPIVPMKPISGNYTQLRTSTSSIPLINRNMSTSESFSKIPVFSTKMVGIGGNKGLNMHTTSTTMMNYSGVTPHSTANNTPGFHDHVDHLHSGTSNSKIPTFLYPGQALTLSKVTPAELASSNTTQLKSAEILHMRVKLGDANISATPNKQTSSTNNSRSSFGKVNGTNFHYSSSEPASCLPVPGALTSTVTKLPKTQNSDFSVHSNSTNNIRRAPSGAGSKIPRRTSASPPPDALTVESMNEKQHAFRDTSSPESVVSTSSSRIPTCGRKPWIFGSHRNTRVVNLDYKKVNQLGFTVCNAPKAVGGSGGTDNGVYVDSVDLPESTVKLGDKLLQVDGIDVSNMNLEIVRKILSNCQQTINLLVSREN